MNELLSRLRDGFRSAAQGVGMFVRSNRKLLIGGFTILGLLLIVWARLGFTLELGRFFAAAPVEEPEGGGGGGAPVSTASCGSLGGTVCRPRTASGCGSGFQDVGQKTTDCDSGFGFCCAPAGAATPTPGGGGTTGQFPTAAVKPTPSQLRVYAQQQGWSEDFARFSDAVLQGWIDNYWDVNVKKFRSARQGVTGYWEKPTECPAGLVPGGPNETDPCISPTTGGGGGAVITPPLTTPTPGATSTPAASTSPVVCTPSSQTVAVGAAATLQATGGNGTFQWTSQGESKTGASVSFTYTGVGTKIVTVVSGAATASCLVTVEAAAPSATPVPADLVLTVTGRNASTGGAESTSVAAVGGNQIEVIMKLRNTATGENPQTLQNLVVRASLPGGLTYAPNTTTINGVSTNVAGVAESFQTLVTGSGYTIGALGPGQEVDVRFRASVNASSFPIGTSSAVIAVTATATGITQRTGQLTLLVTRQAASQPGSVQTGPGDAALVALMVSAIATLLYVSYTNSSAFRRHELERIGKERDPLDFK